jgi:hypothetical protein
LSLNGRMGIMKFLKIRTQMHKWRLFGRSAFGKVS